MESMDPKSENLPTELKTAIATTGTAMVACATIGAIVFPGIGAGVGAGVGAMIGGLGTKEHKILNVSMSSMGLKPAIQLSK